MQSFYKIDMLDISLNIFEFVGETQHVSSKHLIAFRIFNYTIVILLFFDVLINLNYVEREYYVTTLQSLFYLVQILLKYLLLITQKDSLHYILNNILTKFWNYRYFGKYWISTIEKLYKRVRYIQIGLFLTACSIVYGYLLNTGFIIECYVPKSEMLDAIIMLSQMYYGWIATIIVLGYDFIYFVTCIHLILQLRLLKQKMREALNKHDKNSKAVMVKCVKHHQDLICTFYCMKKAYSIMLLFHYLTTLITTCMGLFQLLSRNIDTVNYLVEITVVVYVIIQFGMYSFPAEQIAHEFLDISNVIYASEWYLNSMEVQKLILYVMVHSQQTLYFSGAGLIDINIETFESVLRKALSLCAVVRNLLNN